MNCKHIEIKGNTTKYYFCSIKEKAISGWECNNCPLKIQKKNIGIHEMFQELFGKGFEK